MLELRSEGGERMSEINYLETAKAQMKDIEGDHTVEYVKTLSLVAIANALIAIAERMEERKD